MGCVAGNKDNLVSEMKPKRILEFFPCVVDEGNSVTLLFNIRRIRERIEKLLEYYTVPCDWHCRKSLGV
jgi:hypothetical protein